MEVRAMLMHDIIHSQRKMSEGDMIKDLFEWRLLTEAERILALIRRSLEESTNNQFAGYTI